MLSDPLYLGAVVSGAPTPTVGINTTLTVTIPFATVATGAGSSKRKASGVQGLLSLVGDAEEAIDDLILSTAHSETKENSPYKTDRTLVRLDCSRVDTDGRIVTASVYEVKVLPRSSLFTADDVARLSRILSVFTLNGPSSSSSDFTATALDTTLERLLSGEA